MPLAIPSFKTENVRSEEHTSELQSRENLVCRLLLEKKITETLPGRINSMQTERIMQALVRCLIIKVGSAIISGRGQASACNTIRVRNGVPGCLSADR